MTLALTLDTVLIPHLLMVLTSYIGPYTTQSSHAAPPQCAYYPVMLLSPSRASLSVRFLRHKIEKGTESDLPAAGKIFYRSKKFWRLFKQ